MSGILGAIITPDGGGAGGGAGVTVGAYATRPAAGTSGRLFYPTDGPIAFADDGSAWRPILQRQLLGTQPPLATFGFSGSFVKIGGNLGTSLLNDAGTLKLTTSTLNVAWQRSLALLTNWQVDICYDSLWDSGAGGHETMLALAFMNNLSTKFARYGIYWSANTVNLQRQNFSDVNTTDGGPIAAHLALLLGQLF